MEVSNNIFDILKEELRKKELTIDVFCSNVLKISRHTGRPRELSLVLIEKKNFFFGFKTRHNPHETNFEKSDFLPFNPG